MSPDPIERRPAPGFGAARRLPSLLLLALLVVPARLPAQASVDTMVLRRIREEGLHHSRVLETALGLSDLSPPRLAGSPGFLRAAAWAVERLRKWGIPTARMERWGKATASWVLDGYAVGMTSQP